MKTENSSVFLELSHLSPAYFVCVFGLDIIPFSLQMCKSAPVWWYKHHQIELKLLLQLKTYFMNIIPTFYLLLKVLSSINLRTFPTQIIYALMLQCKLLLWGQQKDAPIIKHIGTAPLVSRNQLLVICGEIISPQHSNTTSLVQPRANNEWTKKIIQNDHVVPFMLCFRILTK